PGVMLLPFFPVDGALAQALDGALHGRAGSSAAFGQHRRALLAPVDNRADYLDDAVGHKKRKELRRQRKRLGDAGTVTSDRVGDRSAVARALNDFFALEAAGWKGRAGTAARDDAEIAQFMAAAVGALAGEGKAEIARLRLNEKPIAAMVTLRSGAGAWC